VAYTFKQFDAAMRELPAKLGGGIGIDGGVFVTPK
jgi:hypothetical protein